MSVPVGGERARYVRDSLFLMLDTALADLGWYDEDRHPIPAALVPEPADPDDEVSFNTLALQFTDVVGTELELGSGLEENRWTCYVDIYAESESIGQHLAGDVRDILRGKLPSIGRDRAHVEVFNFSQATPARFAYAQIERVIVDRAQTWSRAYQRYWWVVRCDVVDDYDNEEDA